MNDETIACLLELDQKHLENSDILIKLIASSWVLEFKLSTQLIKIWFKSEFLTQVFELSQKI